MTDEQESRESLEYRRDQAHDRMIRLDHMLERVEAARRNYSGEYTKAWKTYKECELKIWELDERIKKIPTGRHDSSQKGLTRSEVRLLISILERMKDEDKNHDERRRK